MKFLRLTTFAIAILGMVGLFSCGDDTVAEPTNAEKISGTWAITGGGKAEKSAPLTAIANATANLTLTASGTGLTYTLSTANVPTFTGAAGSTNGSFTLSTDGRSATVGTTTVTIVTSPIAVANGSDLVLSYAIPSAVSTDGDFKTFDTIILTLKKQ